MKKPSTLVQVLLATAIGATSSVALADNPTKSGYITDGRTVVVKDPYGLCWKSPFWTPAMAIAECDPDLIPKPIAQAPAQVPAKAPVTPAAQPVPAPVVAPVSEKVTFAADAFFDFDKATLKPEGKAKLDDMVSKLGGLNLEVIIAVGHTDSVGSDAYNQKLSLRRSEAVKSYLVNKGVEPNRVYTEGKGEKSPVADNKSSDGRAKNRRVEIEVVGTRSASGK
ncbi:MAG: outer membrane protein OmpA [Burkholderiaceae bacterium]|jgi:OOP family OmpA-OmpF porin